MLIIQSYLFIAYIFWWATEKLGFDSGQRKDTLLDFEISRADLQNFHSLTHSRTLQLM